jgi:hypothetical protein
MHYHVSQKGVNIGKYTETDILKCLADGTLTHADYYWAVGMPGWLPLSAFRPVSRTYSPNPVAAQQHSAPHTTGGQVGAAHAGNGFAPPAAPSSANGQMFGYVGGALLALGVFGPAAELGKLSMSIIANGNTKGVFMLALGCCGVLLAYLRLFVFLWIPSGIAALMLGDICLTLFDAPSASLFGATIRLAPCWGLFVMVAGTVLMLCSAWIGSTGKKP